MPKKIILIVGSGRCGSHLLRDILSLHEQVGTGYENYFISSILSQLGNKSHPVSSMFNVIANNCDGNGLNHFDSICKSIEKKPEDIHRCILSNLPKYSNPKKFIEQVNVCLFDNQKIIIDKSHAYGPILPQLIDFYPEVKVLHIIRDGVATARSMSRHSGYRKVVGNNVSPRDLPFLFRKDGLEKLPFKNPTEEACFLWWMESNLICVENGQSLGSNIFLTIRYEDIISQVDPVLINLANFLGLRNDEKWNVSVKKIVSQGVLERQYSSISKKRYNEIQCMGADIQKKFGYSYKLI